MNALLRLAKWPPMKSLIVSVVIPVLDVLLSPATLLASVLMKSLRRAGLWRLPVTRALFYRIGVFPIRDHYYEPFFHPRHLHSPLDAERDLPGIDMNEAGQLALLEKLDYAAELDRLPRAPRPAGYYYDNPNFFAGDAEFYYAAIRHFRPARILEIGSGFSTLMALEAVRANRAADPGYACRLTCVEPYEMAWLDAIPEIEVLRRPVESLDERLVEDLGANDILFIDSSHVVRPQGDVVHEYLKLLPRLASGVLVHVHDIFTPRDYPRRWLVDEARLWNEQYLFEAFMTFNQRFRIIGALNFLAHRHPGRLAERFPVFREQPTCEPGSMWLVSL